MDYESFESAIRDGLMINEKDVVSVVGDFLSQPCIIPSIIYDIRVLKACISSPEWLEKANRDIEGMQSLIARCVEWGLMTASELIISELFPRLTTKLYTDKFLYLRWIGSIDIYMMFRKYDWCDIEWEKSIVFLQRRWRTRKNPIKPKFIQEKFTGPKIVECEQKKKYFGYRQTLYWMRWNRTKRYQLYRNILLLNRGGDCAWQAYVDFLHEDEAEMPRQDEWIEDLETQSLLRLFCSFEPSDMKKEEIEACSQASN